MTETTPALAPTCKTCGFWIQWLPTCGDCMLKPYIRHAALIADNQLPPPAFAQAIMTSEDETCNRWAPRDEVRAFIGGGAEPPAWTANGETPEAA